MGSVYIELKGGEMTLREFTGIGWYNNPLVVIKQGSIEFDKVYSIKDIKPKALCKGDNWRLQSVAFEELGNREVAGYGVMDNELVIEVK